jgi:CRISPR-associated protein Csm1
MDVDDMGNMFSKIEKLTVLSAKSRLLNLFFKIYLNEICKADSSAGITVTDIIKKKYDEDNKHGKPGRNVSVIYAGGDDLFIIGAWDETTELAFDIQMAFEFFTQAGLTITGGLTLHQPKFPLYQMASRSAQAESFAKHDTDKINTEPVKNRIALFYDKSKEQRRLRLGEDLKYRYMLSMNWNLAHVFLLPLMSTYWQCGTQCYRIDGRNYFEVEKFSFSTIEKWFAVIEKYWASNMLYLPTMARVMRGIEQEFGDESALFEQLVAFLYTRERGKENWISHFHIALNWLTYLRRTM